MASNPAIAANGLALQEKVATLRRHHALETLLQNPISFVPASERTSVDEKSRISARFYSMQASVTEQAPSGSLRRLASNTSTWPSAAVQAGVSRGLPNRRVMCYRNSTIQALLHAPRLLTWLEAEHTACDREDRCTICAFRRLASTYWSRPDANREMVSKLGELEKTLRYTSAFAKWRWSRQQDANEFYLHVLNALIERSPTSEPSIKSLLGHRIARTTVCRSCGYRSRVLGPFEYRLGVALKDGFSLEQLLRLKTFATTVVQDYRCDRCKQRQSAHQHSQLVTLPDILEVDFLRFERTVRGSYKKNSKAVPFNQILDLSEFSDSKSAARYDLISVVQHLGSFENGHYICIAKGPGGKWEELDDTFVSNVNVARAIRPGGGWTPYALYYTRSDKVVV